ncbi:MAG: phosphodiester glycosidase family protein [Oscillospiraceae bacterium]|jgi:exopolysaccharide biosynthesis protein|nr:phosphodiester glycosidase family protein [Oscillospiraceae bacterium]MBR3083503.1 phosphodiester glycosidase family protein [Oscillospiraceae bacterium]MBR3860860.1 phosphodiester glycosidase family protein [Oscillospiraceae bacterium]MBR7055975.1 phosphodiester glycosidase family protein [Oscillospiraceae bacterium]
MKRERKAGRIVGRTLLVLLVTVLLLALLLVGVVFVALRGPSTTVQELLTRTLKETSAADFIPDLFLSEERVAEIMSYRDTETDTEEQDISLVTVHSPQDAETGEADAEPEFGPDGINLVGVTGANYRGVMMVVQDPGRVFVGTPEQYGGVGLTLQSMVAKYDAVGGINAGAFEDPNGTGLGGIPEGIVISNGELKWGSPASVTTVIGFDGGGILHVGRMSAQDALDRGIQTACSFGPALIVNGEPVSSTEISSSGVNPRTAIGQRADGAVLLLVVDGRQISSLGATLEDLIEIMLDFGAVTAGNLDGGSSSLMLYKGEAMNVNSSLLGSRPLATAFVVK